LVREVTIARENLGVEEWDDSDFSEPGNRNTNFCRQRSNNIIEAYTGNDVSHKEVRTS
jgi:hypothetical protein